MTRSEFLKSVTASVGVAEGITSSASASTDSEPIVVKEFQGGGLYAIECDKYLSQEAYLSIRKSLAPFTQKYGVEFLILDGNLRISEVRPAGIADIEAAVERAVARAMARAMEGK